MDVIFEDPIDPDLWAIASLLGDAITNRRVRERIETDAQDKEVLRWVLDEAVLIVSDLIHDEHVIRAADPRTLRRGIDLLDEMAGRVRGAPTHR